MTNIENTKVVQANELIQQTSENMDLLPLKVFKVMIASLDVNNPPKDNFVHITKSDLRKAIGYDESNQNYTDLMNKARSLQNHSVLLKKIDENTGKVKKMSVSIVPKMVWDEDSEIIDCQFAEDLMPYLIELKSNFLEYPLINIKAFHSKYGLKLYEWLYSKWCYQKIKNRNIEISVDELRFITGTEKKYIDFRNFKKRLLDAAVDDINQNTSLEFTVEYETYPQKRGVKVTKIIFTLTMKNKVNDSIYAHDVDYEETDSTMEKYSDKYINYNGCILTEAEAHEIVDVLHAKDKLLELAEYKNMKQTVYKNLLKKHGSDYRIILSWDGERHFQRRTETIKLKTPEWYKTENE